MVEVRVGLWPALLYFYAMHNINISSREISRIIARKHFMKVFKEEEKIQDLSSDDSGCSGYYFYIGRGIGAKVYRRSAQVKANLNTKEAKDEMEIYAKLHKKGCDIIPKCYGIRELKIRGQWHVCLLLQHLTGNTLSGTKKETLAILKIDIFNIISELHNVLKDKFGLANMDIHQKNVMIHNMKPWVIDFTPDFCRWV